MWGVVLHMVTLYVMGTCTCGVQPTKEGECVGVVLHMVALYVIWTCTSGVQLAN